MKGTTKNYLNDPDSPPHTYHSIVYQSYSFTYNAKHGPHYTIIWLHDKRKFRNRIGHNKMYVWIHDSYTKLLGSET